MVSTCVQSMQKRLPCAGHLLRENMVYFEVDCLVCTAVLEIYSLNLSYALCALSHQSINAPPTRTAFVLFSRARRRYVHGEVARNTCDSNAFYCDTDGISLLVASIEIDCAGILPNIVQLLFCTSPLVGMFLPKRSLPIFRPVCLDRCRQLRSCACYHDVLRAYATTGPLEDYCKWRLEGAMPVCGRARPWQSALHHSFRRSSTICGWALPVSVLSSCDVSEGFLFWAVIASRVQYYYCVLASALT